MNWPWSSPKKQQRDNLDQAIDVHERYALNGYSAELLEGMGIVTQEQVEELRNIRHDNARKKLIKGLNVGCVVGVQLMLNDPEPHITLRMVDGSHSVLWLVKKEHIDTAGCIPVEGVDVD